eukprot:12321858-Heterocapsa_arctica.AAC.1
MGDSGAMSYHKASGKCVHLSKLMNKLATRSRVENPTIHATSGLHHRHWIDHLDTLIKEKRKFMTPDDDGNYRFPSDMPCVVFDNLNA